MSTKPTREQIESAVTYIQNRIESILKEPPTIGSVHDALAFNTIVSAIPAILADLEAERAAHAETRLRLAQARKDSDAYQVMAQSTAEYLAREKAAHAETRREAREATNAAANHYVSVRTLEGLYSEWQRATGCPTPEEYTRAASAPIVLTDWFAPNSAQASVPTHIKRFGNVAAGSKDDALNKAGALWMQCADARERKDFDLARDAAAQAESYDMLARMYWYQGVTAGRVAPTEPTDEQVERLVRVAWEARSAAMAASCVGSEPVPYDELDERERAEEQAYVRAVIRSLPAPTLPSEEEVARTVEQTFGIEPRFAVLAARAVLDLMRKREVSAPPSDEQLAEEAAHAANEYLDLNPDADDKAYALEAMAGEHEGELWYDLVRFYVRARREGRQ